MKNDSNVTQYTVSELNKSIKNKIEGSFQFLKVSGELFEVKKHSSGHIYFNLKILIALSQEYVGGHVFQK